MVSNPFGSPLTVEVDADTSGLESGLSGAMNKLTSFEGAVGAAGAALAALSAKGIAKTVSAAGDLDAALTESQAIMGELTNKQMKGMEEAAREVGRTTTFSADEAGEAFYFLASAGMDAEQSMAAIGDVAQFAQAGAFDLATATDLSTDALTSLGMAAEDPQENLQNLNRVQDVFVRANELANASVEQYAQAMTNKLGPAMRSAGMEIEEGTAALSVFADAGLKGRRAGTILTRTIEGLQDGARNNAEAFQELGIQVFDAQGEMRPLQQIVADAEDAFAGMSTEQRAAAMEQLGFNQRSRQGMEILLGQSDALGEYQGELENAGGATQRVAEKQLESFNNQVELLKSQFQDIAIEIGTVFLPILERLVGAFSVVVEWFAEINSRTNGMVGAITLLTGLFTGLAMMGWAAVSMLGGLGPALAIVGSAASTAGTALAVLTPVFAALVGAGYVLQQAWVSNFGRIQERTMQVVDAVREQFLRVYDAASNVIVPIVNDIAGAFDGMGLTVEGAVGRIFRSVANSLVAGVKWAGDMIVQALTQLDNWWQQHGDTVIAVLQRIVSTVGGWLVAGIQGAFAVVNSILTRARAWWAQHGDTVISIVSRIANLLGSVLIGAITWVFQRTVAWLQTGQQLWAEHGDAVMAAVGRIVTELGNWANLIGGPLTAAFNRVVGFFEWLLPIIGQAVKQLSGGLLSAFRTLGSVILQTIPPAVDAFIWFSQAVRQAITTIWTNYLQPFVAWFGQMWTQHISGVLQAGLDLWQSYAQSVSQAVSFVWNELLQPFISWFVSAFAQNFTRVIKVAIGIWRVLSNTVSTVISFIWHELLVPFISWYVSTFAQNLTRVLNAAKTAWQTFSQVVGQVVAFVWNELLQPFISWFQEQWRSNFSKIVSEAAITWNQLAAEISSAVTTIWQEVIAPFIAWFSPRWTKLWAQARAILGEFLSWAETVTQTVLEWLQNRWDVWGDTILQTARTLFEVLKLVIGQAMDIITTLIVVALKIIRGDWEGAWMEIENFLGRTKDRLVALVSTLVDSLVMWVKTLAEDIVNWFKWLYNRLVGGSIIPNMLRDIKTAFSNFGSDVVTWITNFVKNFVRRIKNWANRVNTAWWNGLDRMHRALGKAGQQFKSRMSSIANAVVQRVKNVGSKMYNAGKGLIQSIVRGINKKPNAVKKAVASHVGKAAKFLPWSDAEEGPLSNLSESGPGLVQTVAQGIRAESGRMATAVAEMAAGARVFLPGSDAATGPLSDLQASGYSFGSTFAQGIRSSEEEVAAAANSLAQTAREPLESGPTLDEIQEKHGEFDAAAAEEAIRNMTDAQIAEMAQAGATDDWGLGPDMDEDALLEGFMDVKRGGDIAQDPYDELGGGDTYEIMESALNENANQVSSAVQDAARGRTPQTNEEVAELARALGRNPEDILSLEGDAFGRAVRDMMAEAERSVGGMNSASDKLSSTVGNMPDPSTWERPAWATDDTMPSFGGGGGIGGIGGGRGGSGNIADLGSAIGSSATVTPSGELAEQMDVVNELMMRDRSKVLGTEHMMDYLREFAASLGRTNFPSDAALYDFVKSAADWRKGGGAPDLNADAANRSLDRTAGSASRAANQIGNVSRRASNMSSSIGSATRSASNLSGSAGRASSNLSTTTDEVRDLQRRIADVRSRLGRYDGQTKRASNSVASLSRNANRAASSLSSAADVSAADLDTEDGVDTLRRALGSLAGSQRNELASVLEESGFAEESFLASARIRSFATGDEDQELVDELRSGGASHEKLKRLLEKETPDGPMTQAEDGSWVPLSYFGRDSPSGDQVTLSLKEIQSGELSSQIQSALSDDETEVLPTGEFGQIIDRAQDFLRTGRDAILSSDFRMESLRNLAERLGKTGLERMGDESVIDFFEGLASWDRWEGLDAEAIRELTRQQRSQEQSKRRTSGDQPHPDLWDIIHRDEELTAEGVREGLSYLDETELGHLAKELSKTKWIGGIGEARRLIQDFQAGGFSQDLFTAINQSEEPDPDRGREGVFQTFEKLLAGDGTGRQRKRETTAGATIDILGGVSKKMDKLTSPAGGIGRRQQDQHRDQAPIAEHFDSLAASNRQAIQRLEGEMAQRLDTLITHAKNSEGVVRIDGKKAGEVIEGSMHRKRYSTEIHE